MVSRGTIYRELNRIVGIAVLIGVLRAGQDVPAGSSDPVNRLLARIEALEKRVAELEPGHPAGPGQVGQEAAPEHEVHTPQPAAFGTPTLNLRGFGDVGYAASRQGGITNGFGLGQLDLFITSRLSERLGVLVEAVFEHNLSNETGVDLERVLLQYRHNQYLNVDVGRFHSGIGYYNTAFHHGTWFQTAAGRPALFRFEDEGGLLPIHNVGVSVAGRVPSGSLDLHYVAEMGNGRAFPAPGKEAVQNVVDENNGKSVNVGIWAQPAGLRGWRLGGSVYRDRLTPGVAAGVRQTIVAGHVVYTRTRVELLNEVVWMRHVRQGVTTTVPGMYSQASYRMGSWRPYFRYEWMNAPARDPIVAAAGTPSGLLQSATAGIRYELADFAALKFQAGRQFSRQRGDSFISALQLAFTF